jgi:hypothetical protein
MKDAGAKMKGAEGIDQSGRESGGQVSSERPSHIKGEFSESGRLSGRTSSSTTGSSSLGSASGGSRSDLSSGGSRGAGQAGQGVERGDQGKGTARGGQDVGADKSKANLQKPNLGDQDRSRER